MTQKQNILTKTGIVALLACVCCVLWGSAIPVIKTGYNLMLFHSVRLRSLRIWSESGIILRFWKRRKR